LAYDERRKLVIRQGTETELKAKCGKEGSRRRYGRMAVIVRNPISEELPEVCEVLCEAFRKKREC